MIKLYIKENTDSKTLFNIMKKDYHIEKDILYTTLGKPYIDGNPIYFNISNKDKITVLVVSDTNVGIDIERLTYRDVLVRKVFNKEEKELVSISLNKEDIFTKIYTIKEAYSKLIGKGISILSKIDTLNIKERLIFIRDKYYIITIVKE